MPIETFPAFGSDGLSYGHVAKTDSGLRCACPVCSGAAVVVDNAGDGGFQPQAYANADERTGTAANGKNHLTIDQAAFQIVRGDPGWSSALGVGFTVSYAFRANAPATMPDDSSGFGRFNANQIVQAELALAGWSDAANIRFVRAGFGTSGEEAYSDDATMLFGNYSDGVTGASAFAYYPGSTSAGSRAGDVWIKSIIASNATPTVGNYGGMVLVHEIGHAIGLAHPAAYDAGDGGAITYDANAGYFEDSRQYTVMSYFNEANTGAYFGGAYSAAPLLDDIAAAQLEYGTNFATRTGDTVYGFNSNADRPWFISATNSNRLVFAVWDAGGVDTLDFSGYTSAQQIELREGFFSNVAGLSGNVAIAKGAKIENARGGSGSDAITGNPLANNIAGGAGNDTVNGADGADYLRGDDGNDSLSGGADFDDINGNMGNDTASGGLGDDWVVGGQNDDLLNGDAGDDIVLGNLGADTVDGSDGNDIVRGGQGDDIVRGGAGNDFLAGDRGNDTLTGGPGADLFHVFAGSGIDRILDFSQAEGDRINLYAGTTYSVAQVGADTVVTLGSSADQVILVGVQYASLSGGWIFGG